MPIGNVIKNLIGGKAADIVDSVGNVVDRFVQTKEEKEAAQLEMTKIINTHLELMEQEATKQMEQQIKEMDSARNRELQIAVSDKAPLISKIITPILALTITALTFILFYMIMFKGVKGVEKDILVFVLGALTGYVGMVLSYYFGSSLGSHQKQERLDKLIK